MHPTAEHERPAATDPIGVFDSGVGGLSVLHELLVSLPAEDYLYLGDTLNTRDGEGEYRFQCTGDAESFRAVGMRFLQMPFGEVGQVSLPAADKVAA